MLQKEKMTKLKNLELYCLEMAIAILKFILFYVSVSV